MVHVRNEWWLAAALSLGTMTAACFESDSLPHAGGGGESVRGSGGDTTSSTGSGGGSALPDSGTGGSGASGSTGAGGTGTAIPPGTGGASTGAGTGGATGQPCVVGTGPALPFAVDQYFLASGWMQPQFIHQDTTCVYPSSAGPETGDAGAVDASTPTGDSSALPGSKCWTITYTPTTPADWAGVDWQYPLNNWGESDGLVIAPGASKVSLVAWGDVGGERVSFNIGYGLGSNDRFGASLPDQLLTTTPAKYSIDLTGIGYTCSSVRMGFGWVATGGTTMTFHLADIRWD